MADAQRWLPRLSALQEELREAEGREAASARGEAVVDVVLEALFDARAARSIEVGGAALGVLRLAVLDEDWAALTKARNGVALVTPWLRWLEHEAVVDDATAVISALNDASAGGGGRRPETIEVAGRRLVLEQDVSIVDAYDGCGYLIWASGRIMANWVARHQVAFASAAVLELGSGFGISGCAMACFARRTVLSDFNEKLVATAQRNLVSNGLADGGAAEAVRLDWFEVVANPDAHELPVGDKFDYVFGSDLVYDARMARGVAAVIAKYVKRSARTVFFAILPADRDGLEVLWDEIAAMPGAVGQASIVPEEDSRVRGRGRDQQFVFCVVGWDAGRVRSVTSLLEGHRVMRSWST